MRFFLAFLAGGLFGTGLLVSGMTDTTKVQGWLDLFGQWDPTLAFVMGGAIVPMAIAWMVAKRRQTSITGVALPPPPSVAIDRPLVIGSILFGAGWALAGFCPGPAMASLAWGGPSLYIFIAAMLAGMFVAPVLRRSLDRPIPAE